MIKKKKKSSCNAEDQGSTPEPGRSPEKEMAIHSNMLPEKSHGQRSLLKSFSIYWVEWQVTVKNLNHLCMFKSSNLHRWFVHRVPTMTQYLEHSWPMINITLETCKRIYLLIFGKAKPMSSIGIKTHLKTNAVLTTERENTNIQDLLE